jgi:NAD(P)-dependent dehydrogenase (short-subunit alcohol dehydrogenase family)
MAANLNGKAVIVTGGGSGIGKGIVKALVAEGAKVGLADIARDAGAALADELGGPQNCLFVPTDVYKEADIKTLVERTAAHFGRLDGLVNSAAARSTLGPIEDISVEDYHKTMNLYLTASFVGMKHAVPVFKKQGSGAIVNISSLAGLAGIGGVIVYATAKHGIIGLTRAAADQLAPFNIRVNAVAPGWIMTPAHYGSYADVPVENRDAAMRKQFAKKQPLPRAGEPADIAASVLHLLSDNARFVTGQVLVVDGGLSAVSRAFDELRA